MLYTGQDTMTGGRLLKARDVIGHERFMLTYGDGVSDVNVPELLAYHERMHKTVTLTSVQPTGKYGALNIEDDGRVSSFVEKQRGDGTWISGGFFVMEPEIFEYLKRGNVTILEREPLENLAAAGHLTAFKHTGFWKAMDTLKDKNELTDMWINGRAPWALWIK
jgi:glucose-1-phosphate cytidylyltransferase